jgi:integrase
VRAIARQANAPVRDALLLCWWCGTRPAEAYTMTPGELDRSGDVWVYRPGKHKGEHLDRTRQVAIGPRGQAILRPWLARASSPDAVLFRPVGRPGQRPPASYNEDSFSKAVGVAAKKAGLKGIRLRVTRGANLDAARAAMGHSSVAMSGEYAAAQDLETAKKVAREQG